MSELERELSRVLNCHGADNAANTPDYILAMYLRACLDAFTTAVQQRDTHDGRDVRPGRPRVAVGAGTAEVAR